MWFSSSHYGARPSLKIGYGMIIKIHFMYEAKWLGEYLGSDF